MLSKISILPWLMRESTILCNGETQVVCTVLWPGIRPVVSKPLGAFTWRSNLINVLLFSLTMLSSFPLSFKVFCSLYPYHFIVFNSAIPSPFFLQMNYPFPYLSPKASCFSSWYHLSLTVCIFLRLNWLIDRLLSCSVPHNQHTVMIWVSVWYVSVSSSVAHYALSPTMSPNSSTW